jgi:peptidoglycan/xylan/chitin deacetylase (PgdA/CDA1 family)
MPQGKLTISIDLELAWGVWDTATPKYRQKIETAERPVCAALIELFDRHQIPATWAVVAALLHGPSAKSQPGSKTCWYAPDIVEKLTHAKTPHEIGSHGGKHIYFSTISAAEAREDLDFAREIHRANALPFNSLVFPRNAVGHLDLVSEAGFRVFRGPDIGWFQTVRDMNFAAGRVANFADKFLPFPPSPVTPAKSGALVDIPGSMLLLGRNGARRFVLPQVSRAKLRAGLARARHSGETFHLWFHPSNFYYRRDEQLAILAWFLEYAADQASRGHIEICTMGSYAEDRLENIDASARIRA